ncbi:MAG: stage III sporulation protein AG [Candidatus Limivivens sp.]|nr:stage III sporulation protein AG [Candidatus Limivivens sp.]
MEKLLEKKNQWVIWLLLGILLVVIAIPGGGGTGEKTGQAQTEAAADLQEEGEDEVEKLEKRLENALARVEGVGKTKVMLTMEATGEKIVEKDRQVSENSTSDNSAEGSIGSSKSQESSENTVYQKEKDGREVPYVTRETALKIRGVLVVAEGGDNPVIAQNITDAVMALFGVEAHKIKVMKMS